MPNIKKTIFTLFGVAALLALFISEALKEIIKPVTQKLASFFWERYFVIFIIFAVTYLIYFLYIRFLKKEPMNEGVKITNYHLKSKKITSKDYEFKSIITLEFAKGGILNFREKVHVTSGDFSEAFVLYNNQKIQGNRQAASGSNTDIITYSFPEKFVKNSVIGFEIMKTAKDNDMKMRPYLAKTIHDNYAKLIITVDIPKDENVIFTAALQPYYDADDKNKLHSSAGDINDQGRRIYTYEFTNFSINNYCCITWN